MKTEPKAATTPAAQPPRKTRRTNEQTLTPPQMPEDIRNDPYRLRLQEILNRTTR